MQVESDVVVIGGGMAGLVAAAVALDAGLSVTVVTRGHGATASSSGAIDILGYLPGAVLPVEIPADGVHTLAMFHPWHPYTLIGLGTTDAGRSADASVAQVSDAIDWFRDRISSAGLEISGSVSETQWPVSVLGTVKPTTLLQSSMVTGSMSTDADATVLFVGLRGLPDLNPRAASSAYSEWCQSTGEGPHRVVGTVVELRSLSQRQALSSIEIAHHLDTDAGRTELTDALVPIVNNTGATHVVLPPVMGVVDSHEARESLETALGCRVIETLGVPPSVPGSRLQAALERMVVSMGGRLLKGHTVQDHRVTDGRITEVTARSRRRSVTVSASAFVLATGKFVGGGIVGDETGLREFLFGLPVFDAQRYLVGDERPSHLTSVRSVTPTGHRVFACGVGTDTMLRPVGVDGDVVYENLFCAGAILAGYNYQTEKSGLGVALVTGHTAGTYAARETKEVM